METETFASIVTKVENIIRPFGFKLKQAKENRYESENRHERSLQISLFHKDLSANDVLVAVLGELEKCGFKILNIHPDTDPAFGDIYVKSIETPGFIVIIAYDGEFV
jgi:hypothetical protein